MEIQQMKKAKSCCSFHKLMIRSNVCIFDTDTMKVLWYFEYLKKHNQLRISYSSLSSAMPAVLSNFASRLSSRLSSRLLFASSRPLIVLLSRLLFIFASPSRLLFIFSSRPLIVLLSRLLFPFASPSRLLFIFSSQPLTFIKTISSRLLFVFAINLVFSVN
jgi:Na+/melibiose symporter-like transporter